MRVSFRHLINLLVFTSRYWSTLDTSRWGWNLIFKTIDLNYCEYLWPLRQVVSNSLGFFLRYLGHLLVPKIWSLKTIGLNFDHRSQSRIVFATQSPTCGTINFSKSLNPKDVDPSCLSINVMLSNNTSLIYNIFFYLFEKLTLHLLN